jgi:hypothetical protein
LTLYNPFRLVLRAYCVAPRITIVEPHNSGDLLRKGVVRSSALQHRGV